VDLVDEVRAACRAVAERAEHVRVVPEAVGPYAARLPDAAQVPGPDPEASYAAGDREARAAFVLCSAAMNFGSGWWPTVRKRPGRSGAMTMAVGLAERFRARGPWSAGELAALAPAELAGVLGQDPGHEVVGLFATALRDLGAHVRDEFGGAFLGPVEAAGGSAAALAELLAGWACFFDVSPYRGLRVPLVKRAQLAVADLHAAHVAVFADLDRLTAFADNLVPHVLALDGVLRLDPALAARIAREELLAHDSPEEVELRACAVHAVELLSDATGRRLAPAAIDAVLWNRGQDPRVKAHPRPRSRTTAY
jgi:hypothetical protein